MRWLKKLFAPLPMHRIWSDPLKAEALRIAWEIRKAYPQVMEQGIREGDPPEDQVASSAALILWLFEVHVRQESSKLEEPPRATPQSPPAPPPSAPSPPASQS